MRTSRPCLTVLLVAAILLPVTSWAVADSEFHWKGRVAPEKLVTIKTVGGSIEVSGIDGEEVEVTATKSGLHADRLNIQVIPSEEGLLICETYRYDDDSSDTCGQAGSHTHSRGSAPHASYTVRIPKNLRLDASSVNGGVSATGLGRYASLSSVNGAVEVTTMMWAKASSVNGSIRASFGKAGWDTLKLSTVNGSIHVTLPSDTSSEVHFSSVNGHLDSDFPLTIQGRMGRHSMEGKIGNGGRELELSTVNGSVELRKATM